MSKIQIKEADLRSVLEALRKCDAALAEELAAWDIDPPLQHVLEASNACDPAITLCEQALAEQPAQQQDPAYKYLLEQIRQMTAELAKFRAVSALALEHAQPLFLAHGLTSVRNEDIAAIREALAEQPSNQLDDIDVVDIPKIGCDWSQDPDPSMPDTWAGKCGAVWTFTDGNPKENGMRFCPECGKKLNMLKGGAQ